MEGLRCRQSSYIPPSCRPGSAATTTAAAAAPLRTEAQYRENNVVGGGSPPSAAAATAAAAVSRNPLCLYFWVHLESRKGGLPAEKELKRLTIFPALTLVNATPTELDVELATASTDSKGHRRHLKSPPSGSSCAGAAAAAALALQQLQEMQMRPALCCTLRRHSVFFVYEVPPNWPLKFRMRFAMLDGAEWSAVLPNLLASPVSSGVGNAFLYGE